MVEDDLQGEVVDGVSRPQLERFIHAEMYAAGLKSWRSSTAIRRRSCGSASPADRFVPLSHMAGFLTPGGVPVFEIGDVEGDGGNLLITNSELGKALAEFLGEHAVAMMRGHGSVSVDSSLPEAVYRVYYAEVNGRTQADAAAIDPDPRFLSVKEEAAADAAVSSRVLRAWDVWRDEAHV